MKITSVTLRDADSRLTVLSVGAAVQDWQVAGRRVVLGYADPEAYRQNPVSMGVICGRVANRISNARFALHGTEWVLPANMPPHHIHGGPQGLGWRHWHVEKGGPDHLRLTLRSEHLDQGYPGAVTFEVVMRLRDAALTWDMTARPDRETPINLAQHLYFNLCGATNVYDHSLRINADRCTPTDPTGMPTGEILPLPGTRFDFRAARRFRDADPDGLGFDLNYALAEDGPQAEVTAPDGMRLTLWTDRPGLQLYTANTLGKAFAPLAGQTHGPRAGFCLEAQDFPNALNTPGFGSILCSPDRPYRQTTRIRIAPNGA